MRDRNSDRGREMRDRRDGERYLVGRRTSCVMRKTHGLQVEEEDDCSRRVESETVRVMREVSESGC
jgi:hypothetical protein